MSISKPNKSLLPSRRTMLAGTAGMLAAPALIAAPNLAAAQSRPSQPAKGNPMTTITTKDGTQIYYKDWGKGQPVVFSHGWPSRRTRGKTRCSFWPAHGYRCIAHDRRGHGRSSQPWNGNDLDTYADDLAALVEALDFDDAVHVGHSTGGGEVTRYIGRHGTKRVAKAVLVSAIPPLMLKTPGQPRRNADGSLRSAPRQSSTPTGRSSGRI